MGLTYNQRSRLQDIAKEIERAPNHPSQAIRDAWARCSPEAVAGGLAVIGLTVQNNDGYAAYKIIQAWHLGGFPAAIEAAMQFRRPVEPKPAAPSEPPF